MKYQRAIRMAHHGERIAVPSQHRPARVLRHSRLFFYWLRSMGEFSEERRQRQELRQSMEAR